MASSTTSETAQKYLAESLKRFSRSVELCEDYLRGYYGLKKVTDQLLAESVKGKQKNESDVFVVPDQKKVEKLNQLATKKLAEVVRRNQAGEPLWQGYSASEIAAANELLAKSTSQTVR